MLEGGATGDNWTMERPAARTGLPMSDRRGLELDVAGYERLAREVRPLLGIDLACYRPHQVWRRVIGFATSHGCASPEELVARARADTDLRAAFRDMLTINVSEFFRDPAVWERLRSRVVEPLAGSGRSIRVWSAGCSAGYEPYSIAMLFREASADVRVQITATDIDETILATARTGRYSDALMTGVSADRRARFFTTAAGGFLVRPEIRALVTFARQDLLRDPLPAGFDLIVCRNVVIYFTDQAKTELYRGFANSLRPRGTLVTGATESIAGAKSLGLDLLSPGFYARAAQAGGPWSISRE